MAKLPTLLILQLIFIACTEQYFAQVVGNNAYIIGSHVEIGINGTYGHEGVNTIISPPPVGSHFRSDTEFFGYVANPQQDGWVNYDGDFFTPGTPENGWGFEVGTAGTSGHYNCYIDGVSSLPYAGSITNWSYQDGCYSVDWEGDDTTSNLHFKVNYFLREADLFYTTTVSVTNNSGTAIPEMYYYRNVDPDNNVTLSGDYTTTNTIFSQPSDSGVCNLAHVSATQTTPYDSYIGFVGVGENFRVAYRGFSNRDASTIWNGGITSNSDNFEQTEGSSEFEDQAISLAYKIENLNAGATETFRFLVILDDSATACGISNLVQLNYSGSTDGFISGCSDEIDSTSTSCNGGFIPITLTGSTANEYSWSWSPAEGLDTITGVSVVATPIVNTTYTATGIPLSSCLPPLSISIFVEAGDSILPFPTISPISSYCFGSSVFDLEVDELGGTWSGNGIINSINGTFDPTIAGAGLHDVIYSLGGFCDNSDTISVEIYALPNLSLGADTTVCSYNLPVLLDAGNGYESYAWSTGETTSTVWATSSNEYTVTVVDENGCVNSDEISVFVDSCLGVIENNSVFLSIYPNPSTGSVSIVSTSKEPIDVEVIDITGNLIRRAHSENGKMSLNLEEISTGIYVLTIFQNENVFYQRVNVRH